MAEQKLVVTILDEKQKERIIKTLHKVVNLIESETKDLDEQALITKVLMESFEDAHNCILPFHNRYKKIELQ